MFGVVIVLRANREVVIFNRLKAEGPGIESA